MKSTIEPMNDCPWCCLWIVGGRGDLAVRGTVGQHENDPHSLRHPSRQILLAKITLKFSPLGGRKRQRFWQRHSL